MSRRWRKLLVHWGPAVLFMAMIFAVSHVRLGKMSIKTFTHGDKAAHAVEYALLCLLLFRGLRSLRRDWLWRWSPLVALAAASLYGITDEWHQGLVGRDSDIMDWMADTFGAALMAIACWAWMRAHSDPRENEPPEEW